eukprot:CAMPEP_0183561712 /NCGR_PEP_ID=MMETSP0371-20130417/96919_1 /TAXON_ID=268820 /ORGANISM="Peridinium aciculiferum, Strain PAER-2" /LENGTH=261 /DNA_ID=CAMNT_0025770279 /DNA_START=67 /DNA_END=852 /DNA_ORIENTATION=+
MLRALLVGAVGVSMVAREKVNCGNGNFCQHGQTCTSSSAGAGLRFGCAPVANASVCNDRRLSCNEGWACDLEADLCRREPYGESASLFRNIDAHKPFTSGTENFCDIVSKSLPASCTCSNKPIGGTVFCKIGVLFSDHFGLKADVDPCGDEAHIDLQVTESRMGINFTMAAIKAGDTEDIPIPGLTVGIPKVGDADVDVAILMQGSLEAFTVKLGVDACAETAGKKVCGADLTKYLPFWILDGTYSNKGICGDRRYSQVMV